MRLLQITAGNHQLLVPLSAVRQIISFRRDQPVVTLASLLHVAASTEARAVLHLRTPARGDYLLAVHVAGAVHEADVVPLPHFGAASHLPYLGVAVAGGSLNPVLNCDALDPELGTLAGSAVTHPVPLQEDPAPGDPLLVCSLGPFTIRGRPFAIGLALSALAKVEHAIRPTPLPLAPAGVLGCVLHDGAPVPVYDGRILVGLVSPTSPSQLVFFRGSHGLAALAVHDVCGIERPLHWADPTLLTPIRSPHLRGCVPTRHRWIAVVGAAESSDAAPVPDVVDRSVSPAVYAHPAA
jgi:chemotaxis signal transduction protein